MSTRSISTLIVLFFLFFSFNFVSANILINEIAWMGTENSSNDEWIELYNNSNKNISLENYKLIINEKEIKLKGSIKANSFYILERTDENTLPQIKADLIYTGSMKNTGGKLILKNNQNEIIDEADFSKKWKYGDNDTKKTAERIENNWQTSINKGGSPKKENIKNVKKNLQITSFIEIKKESANFPFFEMLITAFLSAITLVFLKKQLQNTS